MAIAAMLPKALVKMGLGLPSVLFAAFFAFNEIDKVQFWIYSLKAHVYVLSLSGGGEGVVGLALF